MKNNKKLILDLGSNKIKQLDTEKKGSHKSKQKTTLKFDPPFDESKPKLIDFDPIELISKLPTELQFMVFDHLSFLDIYHFPSINENANNLINKYTGTVSYKRRSKARPVWMFSDNYSDETRRDLELDDKLNEKSPVFENSLVFRKALADDSYICHLGSHLHKKYCHILGIQVVHLNSVCWMENATCFNFKSETLLNAFRNNFNKNTISISASWFMRKSMQLRHHQGFHLKITITGKNGEEKTKIKENIWRKANYSFEDIDEDLTSSNKYFHFSPETLGFELYADTLAEFEDISFTVAYCDHSTWWKSDADWAFCDLLIG